MQTVFMSNVGDGSPLNGTERVPMDQGSNSIDASTQQIANLAPPTNLSYNPATRILSSSTGGDAELPTADDSTDGLMSSAEHLKLSGIANNATANATNAYLLSRSNHTGTQGAETIAGLSTVATSGAYADLIDSPNLALKADLVGGVIPSSQIPAIAISDYLGAVGSQAAMLALTGQRGDWCLRTDSGAVGQWILSGDNAALLANWVQITVPAAPVQSVNGQVGIVVLGPGDVGAVSTTDPRLTDAREWIAATVEQAEAEAGTSTTRRAWTAQRVRQAAAAWWAATATAAGQALATAADAAAQRLLLGLSATDSPSFAGLTVTGTATLSHIHGALAGEVYQHIRAGANLAALTPYHVDGSQGDTDRVVVVAARGDTADLMPAAGLTSTALANNADGHGVTAGVMTGVNTAGLTTGDPLYVGATGGITLTRPTTGLVQVVAIVGRVHASTGTLVLAVGPHLPAWVYTNTTDAGNISAGTLAAARLPAIGDGLILVISNKGETATAATNYAEVPVPVPSGSFTLVAVRFGCHIDNTSSSSSSTFNAYRRTAAGVKTSVLTGNASLAASASLVDASATITGGTFSAGDRIGVDLVGVGTGAQGLFAQFLFTRSAT
jgi:hypothetical protein